MRTLRVAICACFACVLALSPAAQAARKSPSDVTVILNFQGPWSQISIDAMEREAGLILKSSGLQLGWGTMGQDPGAQYKALVVVTFRGSCEFDPGRSQTLEPGAFAFTHIANGEVMPFAEVNCDRVVGAVRDAMLGRGYAGVDQFIGRALGRVVAHELVHIMTRSTQHGSHGLQQPALSPRQLIEPQLLLNALDVNRLQQDPVGH
jgi:hypothetical protein